ncbi:MAG: TetR/AcrR family transcriptional regulator [Wenzhouxiangellaceae bacterium]|nr:TetR/AcrR family transcriptional regulator [Wenzhouxiangellaceae bacterium]
MNEPTPTRDAEASRARIVAAAQRLFVARGFADVSMREIAAAASVTKGLIHHHFGSKQALWEAAREHLFQRYFEEQKAELEAAPVADRKLLRDGVIKYFRYLQQHPEMVRLLAWSHLAGDDGEYRRDGELVRLGAERVRQAQAAGLIRDDVRPAHVVCTFIHACTHWFEARSHHRHWPDVGDDQAYLDDFLKIFLDGLRPRPENT